MPWCVYVLHCLERHLRIIYLCICWIIKCFKFYRSLKIINYFETTSINLKKNLINIFYSVGVGLIIIMLVLSANNVGLFSFSPTYALVYIIKILSQAVTLVSLFTPTCFDPYGSSSGSTAGPC